VESYQQELAEIKTILQKNPKGMTVTDIARQIHINRNSVAKYLDILLISGHAEMVTFGPAKVFFPSSRIPLSAMLNLTHDYIMLLDKEFKFVQISDNLLHLLNIQRSELIGQTIDTCPSSYLHLSELAQQARRALEGKALTIERRYEHNHQVMYFRIKLIPTTFDDGEPGVTLLIEDITERKLSEEKMNNVIREWETTFNSITDMVFIEDTEFSIRRANQAFAEFFHITPQDCIGKKCFQLIHQTTKICESCLCINVQQTKKPATMDVYEPHLDKYLQVSASPIFNDDGAITGSVHIIKDITTQKKTTMTKQ
jgi:PAS domain S-box-containing protein